MCRTSYFILWVACGHTSREDNRCGSRSCFLEIPLLSLEQHKLCEACTANPSERLPIDQRAANHRHFRIRISKQLADYKDLLDIVAEQQQIMALEQERREEELALSQISSDLMTLTEARRIRFLHNGLVEILRGELDMSDVDRYRLKILRRAMFNIPARLMTYWTLQDLRIHSQRLVDDTNTRSETSLQDFADFDRVDSLSWDERRAWVSQLMNGRRELNRDYATYFEITHLITEREEQERARVRQTPQQSRRAEAIAGLLEPVSIRSLPNDEFDKRCPICMETYGHLNDDGTIETPSRLPCGHVHGMKCVTTWLMENDTCGVCRHNYSAELGIPSPPQPLAQEDGEEQQNFTNDEELPDYEDEQEDVTNEEDVGQIIQTPAPFQQVFSHNPTLQNNQREFRSPGSDTNDEELEPVNMDRNSFMVWGLPSEENLTMDANTGEDEIMRFLGEDQGFHLLGLDSDRKAYLWSWLRES